jgi:predicted PurR-regulated permease PerM
MATVRAIVQALGAYLKAQVQNAGILIGLYLVGFAVLGVPWWGLTGLLCGLLQLIPHLGSLIALGIALLLKGLAGGGWLQLLAVFGAWLAIQFIDGFILAPRAAGRAGIHPVAAILITLAAGIWLGPLGVIFAIPVVTVILIVARAVRHGPA